MKIKEKYELYKKNYRDINYSTFHKKIFSGLSFEEIEEGQIRYEQKRKSERLFSEYCKQSPIRKYVSDIKNFRAFANYHGYNLEKMLHSEYKKVNIPTKEKYDKYLTWCDNKLYTPYSIEKFRKFGEDVYKKIHDRIDRKDFTKQDLLYIEDTKYLYEAKKRPKINQNMCLFYKFYFKRRYDSNI